MVLVRPVRVPADTDCIFGFHRITIGAGRPTATGLGGQDTAVPGRH